MLVISSPFDFYLLLVQVHLKFQELNDEVTDQLNYIEAKIGNGRGSKQGRKAKK